MSLKSGDEAKKKVVRSLEGVKRSVKLNTHPFPLVPSSPYYLKRKNASFIYHLKTISSIRLMDEKYFYGLL